MWTLTFGFRYSNLYCRPSFHKCLLLYSFFGTTCGDTCTWKSVAQTFINIVLPWVELGNSTLSQPCINGVVRYMQTKFPNGNVRALQHQPLWCLYFSGVNLTLCSRSWWKQHSKSPDLQWVEIVPDINCSILRGVIMNKVNSFFRIIHNI